MVDKLENLAGKEEDVQKIVGGIKETYENKTLKDDMAKSTEGLPFAKKYGEKTAEGKEELDYSSCVNAPPCVGGP